jgi:hypothetical protein
MPRVIALLASSGIWLLAAGCVRSPAQAPVAQESQPPPAAALDFVAAAPEAAFPQFVVAERKAANERDLATLSQLWAPDARIVDSRGTAAPEDDYIWRGRADILDRYVVAVFPVPPPLLDAPPAGPVLADGAVGTAEFGRDRWMFVWEDGRWWIQELRY